MTVKHKTSILDLNKQCNIFWEYHIKSVIEVVNTLHKEKNIKQKSPTVIVELF